MLKPLCPFSALFSLQFSKTTPPIVIQNGDGGLLASGHLRAALVASTCNNLSVGRPLPPTCMLKQGFHSFFESKDHLIYLGKKERNTSQSHLPPCCHHDARLQKKKNECSNFTSICTIGSSFPPIPFLVCTCGNCVGICVCQWLKTDFSISDLPKSSSPPRASIAPPWDDHHRSNCCFRTSEAQGLCSNHYKD